MGAKVMLSGRARNIQKEERSVCFVIVTGPATRHPPRGLKLFGQTRYVVECTVRQWRKAHLEPEDDTDLIVEGYLEPRRDATTGQLYVAVIATAIQSKLYQAACRLDELKDLLEECREAYKRARDEGRDHAQLEACAAAFVEANQELQAFLASHPELANRG
ncbi:MAG: hypothetical protein JXA09_09580 [Anaerolineae bacterium]|nr:hypothetical protein [Anaerolineae bacterium]